jgi:Ser/Thr protein kinase RdoA (MazF antagonist)
LKAPVTRLPGEIIARGTRSLVHSYGRGAVVKVPEPSTPDSWIRYEAQYAEAARAVGAPAPRLLGVERIAGRVASVWERIEGLSMWQQLVDRPDHSAALGRALADAQNELFGLVPPVTLPRQRDRLMSKIRRTVASVDASLGQALVLLPRDTGSARLCHGDLHPSNVILHDDGWVIVDWFDASRGDAVADVARSLLTLLSDGENPPRHLAGVDRAALGVLADAYLERMREHRDIDQELLARWQAVSAVARVAEGVSRTPLLEVWANYQRADGDYAAI